MSVFFTCGLKKMFKKKTLIAFFVLAIQFCPGSSDADFSFKGEVDFKGENASAIFYRRENESATLKVEHKAENQYFSVLDVKNLDTRFFDIATVLENTIEVKKNSGRIDCRY